uniref:Leucine rich repeat (in FLII) interacting protein 1b n=1 Tax=Astatotilapia calliptera TaxID=8154 RepID=A0AAX7UPD7_ASTCA
METANVKTSLSDHKPSQKSRSCYSCDEGISQDVWDVIKAPVIRLEGQVSRYKGASENAEKIEDELKVEKRKLQRELRSALDRIDELEVSNSHLSKRLEKMKANRNALLAQQ